MIRVISLSLIIDCDVFLLILLIRFTYYYYYVCLSSNNYKKQEEQEHREQYPQRPSPTFPDDVLSLFKSNTFKSLPVAQLRLPTVEFQPPLQTWNFRPSCSCCCHMCELILASQDFLRPSLGFVWLLELEDGFLWPSFNLLAFSSSRSNL